MAEQLAEHFTRSKTYYCLKTQQEDNSTAFVQDIYHISYFLQKSKLVFRSVSTFGGSLFSGRSLLLGFVNTSDILSLLLEVRYFRGVVTFETLQ